MAKRSPKQSPKDDTTPKKTPRSTKRKKRATHETDITLRTLAGRFADELAKGLAIADDAKVYRTCGRLPATSRDTDHCCYVVEPIVSYFMNVEIEVRLHSNTGLRLFEYGSRLHTSGWHALPDDARGNLEKGIPIPVRSVVFVLTGPQDEDSGTRRYYWQHPSDESGYFEYEVRLVYKMTMAEMMELPCFHWVFLPLAADMTPETLLPHLHTVLDLINSEPDPERKGRLNEIAAAMPVVAHHRKDETLEAVITNFFREKIMNCLWYRNAKAEGREEGREETREEAREEAREAIMDTVRMFLPPETSAALASITDLAELRAAIRAQLERPSALIAQPGSSSEVF